MDMREFERDLGLCSTSVRGVTSRSSRLNRIARVVEFENDIHLFRYLLAWAQRGNSLDLDIWLTAR